MIRIFDKGLITIVIQDEYVLYLTRSMFGALLNDFKFVKIPNTTENYITFLGKQKYKELTGEIEI